MGGNPMSRFIAFACLLFVACADREPLLVAPAGKSLAPVSIPDPNLKRMIR